MEHVDLVLVLDKQQSADDARVCKKDRSHGKLGVHRTGMVLVCGKCDYNEPAVLRTE